MYLLIVGSFTGFILILSLLFWVKESLINRSQADQLNIQKTAQLCKRNLFTIQNMEGNMNKVQQIMSKPIKQRGTVQSKQKQVTNKDSQLLKSPPPKANNKQQQSNANFLTMSFRKQKDDHKEKKAESLQQTLNELQFCKAQLEQSQNTENQLRQRIFKLLEELHTQRTQFSRIIEQYTKDLNEKEKQIKDMENNLRSLKGQNEQYKLNQRKSQLLVESPSKSSILGHSRSKNFLNQCRFILDQERQFVIRHFKGLNLNPAKTQLLYKFDKMRPRNPHLSIDGIKNIILVVELVNGKALAAFSSKSYTFSQNDKQTGQAFIFDLSRKKIFTGTKQCIRYDDRNLVWGQEALVIKENQPKILFSNIQKTSFWDGNTSFQEFLGTPRNWAEINHYQIHQIQFQA